MLDEIGSMDRLCEWLAFMQLNGPLGSRRADLQSGVVAATVANFNAWRERGAKVFQPRDFVLRWEADKDSTTRTGPRSMREQQLALIMRTAQQGGSVSPEAIRDALGGQEEEDVMEMLRKRAERLRCAHS